MKDLIIKALVATNRAGIEKVVATLEKAGFFSAPASIRFQNNYEGGLAEHSYAVYLCALKLRANQIHLYPHLEYDLPLDSVTLVSLLHDVCKMDVYHLAKDGRYRKDLSGFPCGHGEKSVIMLLRMGLDLTDDEILAIRWHMGVHEAKEGSQEFANLKVAEDKCPLVSLLQKADSMASSTAISKQSGNYHNIWDSELWIDAFRDACTQNSFQRLHALRKKAFMATLKIIRQGYYNTEDNQIVNLTLNPSIEEMTVFCKDRIRPLKPTYEFETKVDVLGIDCLDLARVLVDREGSENVSVLNLTGGTNPGGGVIKGSGSQEEYLFRCSDYFRSLYQYVDYAPLYGVRRNPKYSYPLHEQYGGVFSRGVTVFRENEARGYKLLSEPWKVNFIAVAAHYKPDTEKVGGETRLVDGEVHFMEEKVRTILRIALRNNQTTLVLGALGCGAYHNPPKHVAEIFKAVIAEEEFSGVFKAIYFAILDDHNSNGNLASFQKVFA